MRRLLTTDILNSRPALGLALAAFALVTIGWLLYTPEGLLGKSDAVGYAVCHRIEVRSFHLGDRPISFCARCTGMYLGALFGLAYLGIFSKRRGGRSPWSVFGVLGLITLAFGLDGLNSLTNLLPDFPSVYTTTNVHRIFLGTGFGIAMAAVLFPGFNQSAWSDWDRRPAIPDLRTLLILLVGGAVISLLVLTENPLILYPLTLLSAAGVLLVLTVAYSMLGLVLFNSENEYRSYRQMITPLLIGFTLGLLQIAAADIVRYFLTGTWDGFHF